MRRGLIFAIASGLMPTIFASQAHAVKITADGVTVFSDNFENYAVGPLAVGTVPAPGVGSWSAYNPGGPGGNLNVANSSTGAQDPAGVAVFK